MPSEKNGYRTQLYRNPCFLDSFSDRKDFSVSVHTRLWSFYTNRDLDRYQSRGLKVANDISERVSV